MDEVVVVNSEDKQRAVGLFGEKGKIKEGIVEAIRKHANIELRKEDIGVLSTTICQTCYSLVKVIVKRRKFAHTCRESSLQNNNELKSCCIAKPITNCSTVSPFHVAKRQS